MDEIKNCLDELHQYVQSFSRNNQVLKDNWHDKKSEQFSSTCITVVHGNCQEYMQTVEQTRSGINSTVEQLKSMAEELSKEMDMQTHAFILKMDGKNSG